MSVVQATLRKVLEQGFYGSGTSESREGRVYHSEYMCHSVDLACSKGVITDKQADMVCCALVDYMQGQILMSGALFHAGVLTRYVSATDWSASAGRDFYYNWDNRPDLGVLNDY